MVESVRGTEESLGEGERGEWKKSGLKFNIQKIKIIEPTPITSWQKDGEKVEIVSGFIFLGSKITVDGDCSHKTKSLAPWKKSYDKPRKHIKKQRHTLLTKVHIFKVMVFPVVMYGCESWIIKAECQRIDAFKQWCWRRFLRVPWTARRSSQSIQGNQPWIFFGRTGAEVEAPILQPLDSKSQLIGNDPDAGKDWGQEEKGVTENEMVGWHH